MSILQLTVNGRPASADAEPATLLVDLLRGPLGLTGTHIGCDTSQCGACTVLLDGQAVKSCTLLAVQAAGRSVTTIEGLSAEGEPLHPVQEAFVACHGLQCGFCTPGMVMTAVCLLTQEPRPGAERIAHALEGNLCRCTGYVNIVESVQAAARAMADAERAGHRAAPEPARISSGESVPRRQANRRPLGPHERLTHLAAGRAAHSPAEGQK